MISRRGVLTVISAGGVGVLAGCAGITDTDDNADREECDGNPVEIISTEEFENSDGEPSEIVVRIQNRAEVEASYTLIMNFCGPDLRCQTDQSTFPIEKTGTLDGKLTEELLFEAADIRKPVGGGRGSGLVTIGYWEWDTRESECIG